MDICSLVRQSFKLLTYCALLTALTCIPNMGNKRSTTTSKPLTFYNVNLRSSTDSLSNTKHIIQQVLPISKQMKFGEFIWDDPDTSSGRVWITVDIFHQIISVFRAGREIGAAVVIFGTDGYPTPVGQFSILERHEHHRSNLYDAEMPFMLRLTNDGVAIHASDVQKGAATHGCIGVPKRFAELLFNVTRIGNFVVIKSGKN